MLDVVAPFRVESFRSFTEFESYVRESDATRGLRWLYEQSLATAEKAVVLKGTCGLCLRSTSFTAPTRGGEVVPSGTVPNWREGLACACEYRLINRQRALVHLLAAGGVLRSWSRILLLGEVPAMQPFLSAISENVVASRDPLEKAVGALARPRGGYHVILSLEQMTARLARPKIFSALYELLAPGGAFAFTAPFNIHAAQPQEEEQGPVGWSALGALAKGGFHNASVNTYWSEEFGYLGPFNMIVTASRI